MIITVYQYFPPIYRFNIDILQYRNVPNRSQMEGIRSFASNANENYCCRRYVTEVRNLPVEYVYEPWVAPIEVQEQAGCIIGKHYPERIVDHTQASNENSMVNYKYYCNNKKPLLKLYFTVTPLSFAEDGIHTEESHHPSALLLPLQH